jgi:hypothetical protein
MDPFYYLDITSEIKDENNNIIEVYELDCSMNHDGSWTLSIEEYDGNLVYRGLRFKIIEFDNNKKNLQCFHDLERNEGKLYHMSLTETD